MSIDNTKFVEKGHAKSYSSYRKDTPTELIEKIVGFLKEQVPEPLGTAVDVCCGNGQSTDLAAYFKNVHVTSEARLEQAKATRVSSAEQLPFEDGSVQLLTDATAMHWFDLDLFLSEVRRVLCVNGVMAVYGHHYMKPELEDPARAAEIDELYDKYHETLQPYDLNRHVNILKSRYKDVKFSFEEVVRCPDVRCRFEGRLSEIVNYVSTYSGFQNFRKADDRAAEKCIQSFQKRLYEICAACGHTSEDTITLYRDYQLILCRKTKDGPFEG